MGWVHEKEEKKERRGRGGAEVRMQSVGRSGTTNRKEEEEEPSTRRRNLKGTVTKGGQDKRSEERSKQLTSLKQWGEEEAFFCSSGLNAPSAVRAPSYFLPNDSTTPFKDFLFSFLSPTELPQERKMTSETKEEG